MTPRRLWTLLATLALLGPLPALAEAPAAKPDPGNNAALKYWQGFALMPRRDKDNERFFSEWDKVPLDDAAQKMVASSSVALKYLHRGAQIGPCTWGLNLDEGWYCFLPHLDRGRDLSNLACLRIRARFEQGHPGEAAEDVADLIAFARHLGSDDFLIALLVQRGTEQAAIDLAAPHLAEMDPLTLKRLARRLDDLPPGGSLAAALRMEKEAWLGWFVREVKAIEDLPPAEQQDRLLRLLGVPDSTPENERQAKEVRALLQVAGNPTPRQLLPRIEETADYYDEMIKLTAVPLDQAQARATELRRKVKETNPVGDYILPRASLLLERAADMQARMALFRAAVAVAQGGPERLKEVPDPFGQGPFEYRALPKGFELKSKLTVKGQPLTLRVGPAQKP
jgi:hypothetical protein